MTIENDVERLRRMTILAGAKTDHLRTLAGELTWRTVAPQENVVSLLSADGSVYFIDEGEFQVRLAPIPGRSILVGRLHPRQHFGEIAILAAAPRSVSVTAVSAGIVGQCPSKAFQTLLDEDSSVGRAVATHLARTVVSLTDRLYETAALEVRFRIQAEVLRLAKTAEPSPEGLLIRNAPTHDAIAQSVGTHREAVSKEFKFLGEQGLLRQTGRQIVVFDIEKLRELSRKHAGLLASQVVEW